MGPGVAKRFHGTVDHHAPLMFDAERTVAGDLAKLLRRHVVLSRSIENVGKFRWSDGDDGAGAAFVEKNGFGGEQTILKGYDRAEMGRSMLRAYRRRGRCGRGRETGFGEGDG